MVTDQICYKLLVVTDHIIFTELFRWVAWHPIERGFPPLLFQISFLFCCINMSKNSNLLGYRDSNPERKDQNLACYHYTIAQFEKDVANTPISTFCQYLIKLPIKVVAMSRV